MSGRSALAICAIGLCLAMPAEARDRVKGAKAKADAMQPIAALTPAYNPALGGIGRNTPASRPPLAGRGPRVRFSADSVIREDGSPGDRRSVVGALPLMGAVAAEVGLFSVSGATPKEREFKRNDPVADVQPRRSRVAAIGLRMSF
ncbi:MAG TPA: hypothetical protein VGB65_05780 [Allosphingosinicella sp.]|jgi:hypothetical protein